MKISDLAKLLHILMLDVKPMEIKTFKGFLLWALVVILRIALVAAFLWFLVYVLHLKGGANVSFGR